MHYYQNTKNFTDVVTKYARVLSTGGITIANNPPKKQYLNLVIPSGTKTPEIIEKVSLINSNYINIEIRILEI